MTDWRARRVFITGHTGFKGSWLCHLLARLGAEVCGYALPPDTSPDLFGLSGAGKLCQSLVGDICDYDALQSAITAFRPEYVIHMAAQPLVRESYRDPLHTYRTNTMGTSNLLEAVRKAGCVKSVLNVTTDKVYRNNEWFWGYREQDTLDGYDPYSNSKSCSELITGCYARSYLAEEGVAVSTARAGNVIGGGDFSADRIVPDCVRAAVEGKTITLRNPSSIRPYQHVLDPLCAYLQISQAARPGLACSYNVGPDEADNVSTGALADMFCRCWGGVGWKRQGDGGPHEAGYLRLDCSRLKAELDWKPVWGIGKAMDKTVEWYKAWQGGQDLAALMAGQIDDFLKEGGI